MTNFQKVIKYLAIALAIFIIFNIVSAIFTGIATCGFILGLKNKANVLMEQISHFNMDSASSLEIELVATELTIKESNELKVESNSKNITCKQNGNKIEIEEKKYNWFFDNNEYKTTVYVPSDMIIDFVKIEAGAGKINIEKLHAKTLDLELGAGKVEIKNLQVIDKAKIEGGAGKVNLYDSEIHNLNLSMGVGAFDITSEITGTNKIDAGIGKLSINVLGSENEYKVKANKGIGTIKVAGNELKDNSTYGDGENTLDVDGGIGMTDINFVQK